MENFKDIPIGARNFRLGRMTAMVGSWVLNILLSSAFKSQSGKADDSSLSEESASFASMSAEEKASASISAIWITAGSEINEDTYAKIQRQCLRTCSLYVSDTSAPPIPILSADGRWSQADLEQDIKTVNELILEALKFNLSPFFTESVSNQKQAEPAAPILNPSASRTATALPFAR